KGFGDVKIEIGEFNDVEEGREIGHIRGTPFRVASKDGKRIKADNIELPLRQSRTLGFGLYVDKKKLGIALSTINVPKASPVTISDSGISPTGDLYVEGVINTTTPLFPGTEVPFSIVGETMRIDFPIPVDKLRLGPLHATWASISIIVSPD